MPTGPSSVTWKDLARAAGVSRATASLALNNHPRVAARTRARVAQAAARIGFVSNQSARRLARARRPSGRIEQVGFMYVTADQRGMDLACAAMIYGAETDLDEAHPCLIFSRVSRGNWDKVQRLVRSDLVDGWLLAGLVDDELVDGLRRLAVPHVIVGDHHCTQPVHAVTVDYFGAGRAVARHLVERGDARVGFVGGNLRFAYQTQSLAGLRAGLAEGGLAHDDSLIIRGRIAERLRALGEPPSAVFSAEVGVTDYVIREAADAGLPRPPYVVASEIGRSSALTALAADVTRVEWPMEEVGRQGVALLRRVAAEPRVASCDIRLSATLVSR